MSYFVVENEKKLTIASDLLICPYLELWLFIQVQGHYKKNSAFGIFQLRNTYKGTTL